MNQKILVIGGTGMLGKPVALKLKEAGFDVTVFTRNATDARIKMPSDFNFAEGDVNDIDTLKKAMHGHYGVHINLQGGHDPEKIFETEFIGVVNIVDAAKETGVKKISIITGSTVSEANSWFHTIEAKYKAENYISTSGLDYTIFKPSWFFESLPQFVRNGKAMVIGNNMNAYRWLSAIDYANLVAKAYINNQPANKAFYIYGPETMTIEEAMKRYIAAGGLNISISKIPLGFMKFLGFVTFNPMLKFVTRLSAYFETVGDKGDNRETETLLGSCNTTLEEWTKNIRK
jgi:NADH dehydrogenase